MCYHCLRKSIQVRVELGCRQIYLCLIIGEKFYKRVFNHVLEVGKPKGDVLGVPGRSCSRSRLPVLVFYLICVIHLDNHHFQIKPSKLTTT